MDISKIGLKVLHYVIYGPPVSAGYTIRTHSIVKAQKKQGLLPSVAISLKSLIGNYNTNLNFASKNIVNGIAYYSAHNELMNDPVFELISKLLMKNNRVSKHLKEKFYSFRNQKILSNYFNFISDDIGSIDLIHAHVPSIAFNEAYFINKFLKKKIIYEVRGFWNLSLESFDKDMMNAVKDEVDACQKADKCIAICKGIADVLIKGGISSDKIEIVPNGVDPDKFIIMDKDLNLSKSMKLDDKIIFGYVTSVRWFEGIQTMVKAWPKILKEIPNAIFLLIGDGNYLETIKDMIKEYDIENSFLALGRIQHDSISSYYSLIDVFVVPRIDVPVSHIVTPLKPLEAMINRKPVVVSDVNALKEMVIDGETGLHFKADDHNHLADVCIQLAKDSTLRDSLGNQARNWVLENRTWEKIAGQYSEIYNKLLN